MAGTVAGTAGPRPGDRCPERDLVGETCDRAIDVLAKLGGTSWPPGASITFAGSASEVWTWGHPPGDYRYTVRRYPQPSYGAPAQTSVTQFALKGVDDEWRASVGPSGRYDAATLRAWTSDDGSLGLTLRGLSPRTSYPVTIRSGSCSGAIVASAGTVTASASGTVTRTVSLSRSKTATIRSAAARGRSQFTLKLRIPVWSAATRCSLNGDGLPAPTAGTYLSIARTWQPGDRLDLAFDFSLRTWHGLRECAGQVSLYRGPLLLAFDQRYNCHLFHSPSYREGKKPPQDPPKSVNGWVINPQEPAFGSDPWNLSALTLAMPAIDLAEIVRTDTLGVNRVGELWDDWLPPFFLAEIPLVDGRKAFLCDYISAGQTGTLYRSWLDK